jgi:two-component system, chemotaxis family, chemotaxis protein CheY
MQILIVDDDFSNRLLLQKWCGPYGESHFAANGTEAIQAFDLSLQEKRPYDLILLDIMMPELNGHEVLQQIRDKEQAAERYPPYATRIVMVTALDDMKNIFSAFKGLADSYLTKPLQPEQFRKTMTELGVEATALE